MGTYVCPEGIMCCNGSANPPCEFLREMGVGYQPIPQKKPQPQHAITHRNLLWGLYVRVLDGDVIWESWLWGAYRRRKRAVPELLRALNACGGVDLMVNGTTYELGEASKSLYAGTPTMSDAARIELARHALADARAAVEAFKKRGE